MIGTSYKINNAKLYVSEYSNKIQAPYKEFIWFEDSAHFPQFEEVDKFTTLMLRIKDTYELKQ